MTCGGSPQRAPRLVARTRLGVSGHSIGGGCALLAASPDSRFAALTTTAANTNSSAVTAMAAVTAPVQFLAGSSDTVPPRPSTRSPCTRPVSPRGSS